MAKKTIIITFNHPPFSGNFCQEGLRAVVGTQLSIDEQDVKTIFMGDGVYFGLKDVEQQDFQKYLKTMKSSEMDIYLEEESINERHIQKEQLNSDFKILPRTEVLKLFKESDHVLAF